VTEHAVNVCIDESVLKLARGPQVPGFYSQNNAFGGDM
jgi:hypothetical protein